MRKTLLLGLALFALLSAISCSRFRNAPTNATAERYVVISPIYNEIIWAAAEVLTLENIRRVFQVEPRFAPVQSGVHLLFE